MNIKPNGTASAGMQTLIKGFFDLIKTGDIDSVVSEMERNGIDVVSIVDNIFESNVISSACTIKNEDSSLKMVKLFLQLGVKVNQSDKLTQTPLFYAAKEGHLSVIDLLVEKGCNPNHIDNYG
jgi:ankyrin repeat protein